MLSVLSVVLMVMMRVVPMDLSHAPMVCSRRGWLLSEEVDEEEGGEEEEGEPCKMSEEPSAPWLLLSSRDRSWQLLLLQDVSVVVGECAHVCGACASAGGQSGDEVFLISGSAAFAPKAAQFRR